MDRAIDFTQKPEWTDIKVTVTLLAQDASVPTVTEHWYTPEAQGLKLWKKLAKKGN
tara:strand:+ start:113 stop:280 length:168 start_codon:yes stop_codon:yes gene_type:complete